MTNAYFWSMYITLLIYGEINVKETYTKEETKSLKVGMLVAVILGLIFAFSYFTKEKVEHSDNGTYYPLLARFGRTDGLMLGGKVRLAGIDVGRVVNAQLDDNFNALLTLDIKEGYRIPADSSAAIVSSSVMGSKYIEIEPGGDEEYLQPNDEFSYTQDAMVVEELVDRIISIGKANRSKNSLEAIEKATQELEN